MHRGLFLLVVAGSVLTTAERLNAQTVGRGNILVEYWFNGGINDNLDTLKAHRDFPKKPHACEWLQSLERSDLPWTDCYGVRLRGYLYPPRSEEYTFWISGPDDSELWVSSSDDFAARKLVSSAKGGATSPPRDNDGMQQSEPVPLTGGKPYYIEVLFSTGTGSGYMSVAWSSHSLGNTPVIIQGEYLAPYIRDPEPLLNARDPEPSDDATGVTTPQLQWTAGQTASFHDVYLGTTPHLTQADLVGTHQSVTTFRYAEWFQPGVTYYWRVDEVETGGRTYTGDVWKFMIEPLTAFSPIPSNGDFDVFPEPTLRWLSGAGATTHEVYFGDNLAQVSAGSDGTFKGAQTQTNFPAGTLKPGTTYYWRVDESDGIQTRRGDLWRFRTASLAVIEDFEGYTNDPNQWIFRSWTDGVGWLGRPPNIFSNGTGATIGHDIWRPGTPYTTIMETVMVHGGRQSMPLYYDNSHPPFLSQVDFVWPTHLDFDDVDTLVLYLRGQPGNDPAPLSIMLTDRAGNPATVSHPNPKATVLENWQRWTIRRSEFKRQNLDAVAQISIVVGGSGNAVPGKAGGLFAASAADGGSGMILWDDISATVDPGPHRGPDPVNVGPDPVWLEGTVRNMLSGKEIPDANDPRVMIEGKPYNDAPECKYSVGLTVGRTYSIAVEAIGFDTDNPDVQVSPPASKRDLLLRPTSVACDRLVYRFLSSDGSKYFCTASASERDKLLGLLDAWTYRGVAFRACAPNAGQPVYRFWSAATDTHFFTINEKEKNKLIREYSSVWTYEGEAFRAHPPDPNSQEYENPDEVPEGTSRPVYRLWSSNRCCHFYTICKDERDEKLNEMEDNKPVWTNEGVAWYAFDCVDLCELPGDSGRDSGDGIPDSGDAILN
jgi:hypothetical protein